MSKNVLREWLDALFPSGDERRRITSVLVDRGLEALREARDERAFTMGDVMRVPSRLELRIPKERFDELREMDALRDMEFYFNDELMKDLSARDMRTFGDHAVRVTVAPDETLQPDEIYGMVLAPEAASPRSGGAAPSAPRRPDATQVLGEGEEPSTIEFDEDPGTAPVAPYHLVVTGPDDHRQEGRLEGVRWIIGRRGTSGKPLPDGYRKVDLDVRETVSREQVRAESDGDRLFIQRIGKAAVAISERDVLKEGEQRVIPLGNPFYIDDYEITITH